MTDKQEKIKKIEDNHQDVLKFEGEFIYTVGRRKTAIAQVRVYKDGDGSMTINNQKLEEYFPEEELHSVVLQPLKLTGLIKDLNVSVITTGGGKKAQTVAIRHGLARALEKLNEELRPALKAKDWLTRDARKKERKKPGLKKARRAPQWGKR
ncbi:30S ribosomal protein S9 [Patescibacteria group bacterium]|nr:30S ribosomal protein S9 [Patescibacteria group bacterium]MBU0879255.1 30S ribosomal protein S9 [Patescibacteria group bacterium]MBU0880464.1 30S ribosomal protein S9 [Patescibacteria group bacterium]MBU0897997.1 30S ribosomal protein S9 [Patescibacteria group bacterium]MBU1062586.1 30S ribosomal protein S9 [Patescibacteria group bacterium]